MTLKVGSLNYAEQYHLEQFPIQKKDFVFQNDSKKLFLEDASKIQIKNQ